MDVVFLGKRLACMNVRGIRSGWGIRCRRGCGGRLAIKGRGFSNDRPGSGIAVDVGSNSGDGRLLHDRLGHLLNRRLGRRREGLTVGERRRPRSAMRVCSDGNLASFLDVGLVKRLFCRGRGR